MLNEIIEMIDKSQKEAKDLAKEKKFYQDEVQNLKNEIANIRLENDKLSMQFSRSMQESL
jgi:predicted nuclease with TOPRIM domain